MKLNVRVWGDEGAPACVLLHGITSNTGAWFSIGPALAAAGLRVFAPDMRGHGESPSMPGYDVDTLLADLIQSVPANPDLLVGHSFGGYLAQEGVLKGLLSPRALVLEDPVSHQPDPETAAAMLTADREGLPRSVDGIMAMNPRWSRLDAAWKILSLEQVDWDGAVSAFAGNAPWDLRPEAARLKSIVPTAWILPGVSRFVPAADVQHLQSTVGAGSVVIASQAGHSIHRDEPDLFMAVVLNLLDSVRESS